MSVIQLRIIEPQNGTAFPGVSSVHLRGSLESSGHRPLFYKWYSSLNAPIDPANTALNQPGDNPLDFAAALKLGSHVITFTAKDTPSDSQADLRNAQDMGMAGGPPSPPPAVPCVIHVLLANMVAPAHDGDQLSKTGTLRAEAPYKWGRKRPDGSIENDPDYHLINRIAYRWIFTPSGAPAGRATGNLALNADDLTFFLPGQVSNVPVVQYHGGLPLPGPNDLGTYTVTLRVEDAQNPATGHQVDRQVIITP